MQKSVASRTPASFWIVSVLALAWNSFGSVDFVLTNMRDQAYLSKFPVEIIDWLDEMPLWALAVWTIGVWGAVAGSLLLLLRSRFAVLAFAASLAGLALSTLYQVMGGVPPSMRTPETFVTTGMIWAGALFFVWYAVRSRRSGILR